MLETTTAQLLERGRVACRFDDHTMNTPRNRLVRAALERLASRVSDAHTAHRCRALAADLSLAGVRAVRPSRAELSTDAIGRNETADRVMVTLSRMVFDLLIPTEDMGDHHQRAQDASEQLVRRLFERAIGNALRMELEPKGWRIVQGRRLSWPLTAVTGGVPAVLPGMQTDIEASHVGLARRIVIDTKFTRIFTSSSYREEILSSGHLYQLYAYLRTQEDADDHLSMTAEGMLVHPRVGASVDEAFHLQGHRFRFRTIDLAAPAQDFEDSIRRLLH
jgi:5-methylcytosine-specific restriction enzyme subunit McrC